MATEQYRPMTTHQLCEEIDRFITDNQHSRDLDDRWFASVLVETLGLAREVRNKKLSPEARKLVNAFRAVEIEKELETKRRDVDVLERDLKKVKEAAA